MKKFHITITDNDTGAYILDTDSDAIIGAVENDIGVNSVAFTNCSTKTYAQTIAIAQIVVKKLLEEDKALKPLVRAIKLLSRNRADT